jgi:hypothetical protein
LREKTVPQHIEWDERTAAPRVQLTPSVFPDDAVVVIYKPVRSAMTSGKARAREWKLRFEPRSPRYIEPLMGWTGSDDTLSQVELTFPSAESAAAYARRQGLHYVVQGERDVDGNVREIVTVKPIGSANAHSFARPRRQERIEYRNGVQSGNDLSVRYAAPQDVLRDPALSEAEKREVLRRWALDSYLIELTPSGGDAVPHPSRLDEVIDVLLDLDEPELRRIASRALKTAANKSALAA